MNNFVYFNETCLDRFLESYWEQRYLLRHNRSKLFSVISLKKDFFKLLLDCWSDFHQNRLRSSSDHVSKKLLKAFWLTKPLSNNAASNLTAWCQADSEAATLQSFGILKPNFVNVTVISHWQHDINFAKSATYWSKVIGILIILLVILFMIFQPLLLNHLKLSLFTHYCSLKSPYFVPFLIFHFYDSIIY